MIYSPRDRTVDEPFPKSCQTFVYSETTPDFTSILRNRSDQPLTYTLVGCGIDKNAWADGVKLTIGHLKSSLQAADIAGAKIKTDALPNDFGNYLTQARNVQQCILAGDGPFAH